MLKLPARAVYDITPPNTCVEVRGGQGSLKDRDSQADWHEVRAAHRGAYCVHTAKLSCALGTLPIEQTHSCP